MNIRIGLNKDIDRSRQIISNYLPEKKVKIDEYKYNSRYFFNITPIRNKSVKDFYDNITDMILELILNIYTEDIIKKQINIKYKKLRAFEKKEIFEISKKLLINKDNFIIEKQYLINQIKNYVTQEPSVSIDGFVIFRLKDLNLFINLVIDKGIEEFTAKKEYKEFISILKYFVDIQESKYKLINLCFEGDDYTLVDENNNKIDTDFFEDVIIEIDSNGISQDDLLISALIVLAPENLIIHLNHKDKDADVIKIITDIFEDKAYFCLGCEKCREELKVTNNK